MTKHIHGGDVYKHKDCLDFSANLNPLGTPESVKQAIIHSLDHIAQYPQVGCGVLRERIAESEALFESAGNVFLTYIENVIE